MKTIGIDARFYGTEQKGLGRYVQKLLEGYAHLDAPYNFTVFLSRKGLEQYQAPDKRFHPVLADIPWYGWREQKELPKILNAQGCDLWHFPHFNVPYFFSAPFVVTIHDLILFDHPSRRASTLSWPLYQAKYAAFKINLTHALRQAKHVITVSEHTKNRVLSHFPWTKDKISAIHIAPGHHLDGSNHHQEDFGLAKPYLLYVGNAYPHKNLEFLLRAFHHYVQTQQPNLHLVFVGKLDYFYFRLQELTASLSWPQNNVQFFGYATESQLSSLYTHASAYVFPSLEEGFGIPPLEAMSYGLPVISSNQGSMPEILGDAALYFDPKNARHFEQSLRKLLSDEALQNRLITLGQQQVLRYDWLRCAKQTQDIYSAVISRIEGS